MSCFSSFDRLCRKIVMPTRHQINDKDMIQRKFRGLTPPYELISIPNNRNQQLSTLIFYKDSSLPTIIYLHGNGGNKIQVLHLVKTGEQHPFNMVAFDFSGCGKSEGELLTYGQQQVDDINAVVEYLRRKYRVQNIFLWGRSMGASLGLLYAAKYPNVIKGIVLDSPFRTLEKIVYNVAANTQAMIPNFLLSIAVFFVKNNVQNIVGYDIFQLDYSRGYENIIQQRIPLLFAFSTKDNVVKSQDVREMYLLYGGPKKLTQFSCLHPEDRPKQFVYEAMEFLLNATGIDKQISLQKSIQHYDYYSKTVEMERKKYSMTNLNSRNKWNEI